MQQNSGIVAGMYMKSPWSAEIVQRFRRQEVVVGRNSPEKYGPPAAPRKQRRERTRARARAHACANTRSRLRGRKLTRAQARTHTHTRSRPGHGPVTARSRLPPSRNRGIDLKDCNQRRPSAAPFGPSVVGGRCGRCGTAKRWRVWWAAGVVGAVQLKDGECGGRQVWSVRYS